MSAFTTGISNPLSGSRRCALEDHPVGSEPNAIQNDRVFVAGTPMQGPIFNLFQLENAAQQIYPDECGAVQGPSETHEDQ